MRYSIGALFCLFSVLGISKQPVTIHIDASQQQGPLAPLWAYFGYDEPNYTYMPNGRKLISELAALSYTPVHIRTHFLLASGDGTARLKWGSTNAYAEDSFGRPIYNWAIVDKIIDTYLQAGAIPFIEIGFMPRALSSHPYPYEPNWQPGNKFNDYFLGWTYPPNDYRKWSDLIYEWVKHCVQKYGRSKVETWNWEVWNEPDIGYWHGTPEEYDTLYDYTADAVKRALPTAHVGGPASTGPSNPKAAEFLKQFLQHCSNGKNHVNGLPGAPLDFITFHAKGRPQFLKDHVQMGLAKELQDATTGFRIVRSFPKFQNLPVVLSEADPEGCAACSAKYYPANAYRNDTLYASYEAVFWKTLIDISHRERANLEGFLTWAFEFENQPYFEGFRTLATNGIDKPVLNMFRMAGLMRGDTVSVRSEGALPAETILNEGVTAKPDVDALATRTNHTLSVLIWNYKDDQTSESPADIDLRLSGLPVNAKRLLLTHYRIDQSHSNAYTAWREMGSPQNPTSSQYERLERAGQLQQLGSPRWISGNSGIVEIRFTLPLHGLSLVQLNWDKN